MSNPLGEITRSPEADQHVSECLEPRDQLVHLREWLNSHRQLHTRHFPDSDASGHPHGYDGVVIPVWDLRQRLDDIQAALDAKPSQPGIREACDGAENAIRHCPALKEWGPSTYEHLASRVANLCNLYNACCHTLSLIADERDRLKREAACPCCKNGVNIEGDPCQECKGSGYAIVAYETLRIHWKRLTEQ
jgi:hypothetical protein